MMRKYIIGVGLAKGEDRTIWYKPCRYNPYAELQHDLVCFSERRAMDSEKALADERRVRMIYQSGCESKDLEICALKARITDLTEQNYRLSETLGQRGDSE